MPPAPHEEGLGSNVDFKVSLEGERLARSGEQLREGAGGMKGE